MASVSGQSVTAQHAGAEWQLPRRGIVLLIEDEPNAREALTELLGALGHTVMATRSVAEALAIQRRPDVIVTDINLPDGSGFQLARRLRSQAGWSEIPVIGISGGGDFERYARAEQEGFVRYLVKPISFQDLHQTLVGLLRRA